MTAPGDRSQTCPDGVDQPEQSPSSSMAVMVIPPVADHVERLLGVRDPSLQLAKVVEEAGEAMTAYLQTHAGYIPRDSTEEELADVAFAAIGALQMLGHNVADVMAARWEKVSARTAPALERGGGS